MSTGEATPEWEGRRETERLRRVQRLRKSREFREVSRRGRRVSSGAFVVLSMSRRRCRGTSPEPGGARLGLTVSRRVGGAVVRNAVKRRVREWFRRSPWPRERAVDVVVIARAAAGELGGEEIAEELERLAAALGGKRQ